MPPPWPPFALLPERVSLSNVRLPKLLYMPPPLPPALLSEMVSLLSVRVPPLLTMAPPLMDALLPEMVSLLSVQGAAVVKDAAAKRCPRCCRRWCRC